MRINDLLDHLNDASYPTTTERLVAELDDPELRLANGSDSLANAFARIQTDGLETPSDAKLAVLAGLDEDAIGRKGYTDRDPPVPGERRPERLTF